MSGTDVGIFIAILITLIIIVCIVCACNDKTEENEVKETAITVTKEEYKNKLEKEVLREKEAREELKYEIFRLILTKISQDINNADIAQYCDIYIEKLCHKLGYHQFFLSSLCNLIYNEKIFDKVMIALREQAPFLEFDLWVGKKNTSISLSYRMETQRRIRRVKNDNFKRN